MKMKKDKVGLVATHDGLELEDYSCVSRFEDKKEIDWKDERSFDVYLASDVDKAVCDLFVDLASKYDGNDLDLIFEKYFGKDFPDV